MNGALDSPTAQAIAQALGVRLTGVAADSAAAFVARMLVAAQPAFGALPFQSEPAGHAAVLRKRAP